MQALLLLMALGAFANPDPTMLVISGTATESGTAVVAYDLDGCPCEASVAVAVDDTAAEVCEALKVDLDGDCEPDDPSTLPTLRAQLATKQAEANALATEMRNLNARIESILGGKVWVIYSCESLSGKVGLAKFGGEQSILDSGRVSMPAGITPYLPGE